jgi:hypothetical protein
MASRSAQALTEGTSRSRGRTHDAVVRQAIRLASGLVLVACNGLEQRGAAWDPGEGTTGGASSVGESGGASSDGGGNESGSSGSSDTLPQPTSDGETTGGEMVDCTPAWQTTWIGSPCAQDGDCAFEGGACLLPADGFPCGTCSMDCTMLCPDLEGAPTTYCIDGSDVGLSATGYCLSQCDTLIIPGEGCRDGYACRTLPRFDASGAAGVCVPDAFDDGGDELVSVIDHEFLIEHFGGTVVDANDYGPDVDSFQMYLDDVGVQHTTAEALTDPYNPSAATMCGYTILLPERDQWEKAAALGLFTDVLTELVGEPIFVRNWWRPDCYNEAVGGAAGGDHPPADAFDLDFASEESRALAQSFLCDVYWNEDIVPLENVDPSSGLDPRLNMSVGLGGITIHLGVLSEDGRRFWYYDSYTDEPESGDCW